MGRARGDTHTDHGGSCQWHVLVLVSFGRLGLAILVDADARVGGAQVNAAMTSPTLLLGLADRGMRFFS